jgi:hypothetical protein
MDYRQANMIFPNAKLVQQGGDNIDEYISEIREAILSKEGIVSDDARQDFRFFVKNCMSTSILDQIGGDMNSFNKRSFRLKQLNQSRSSQSFDRKHLDQIVQQRSNPDNITSQDEDV